MCYDFRPPLSGPNGVPPFVQVLRWSLRIFLGSRFHVPRFEVGTVAAVMASGDAVAMARAEASLCQSFYDGLLQHCIVFFLFAHVVAVGAVVAAGVAARIIGTTLGF